MAVTWKCKITTAMKLIFGMAILLEALLWMNFLPPYCITSGRHLDRGFVRHRYDDVCIVGNSQTLQRAIQVQNMWGAKLPSFWYIWGQQPEDVQHHEKWRTTLLWYTSGNLSFVDGLEVVISQATASKSRCRWIFTHDDDLEFHFSPIYLGSKHTHIAAHLLSVLEEFDPAVAGFPWDGVNSDEMQSISKLSSNSPVTQLTGFDNGMVIYRRDILSMIIPFRPRGEGDFFGNWTLGAHHLNMMIPWTFKGAAINIHSLAYTNTISMNNMMQKSATGKANITWQTNNLVFVEGSRHPYEYKMNSRYIDFLRAGLKCLSCSRFGKQLLPEDLDWVPRRGLPFYSPFELIEKINAFYDLRHPAVSDTKLLRDNRDISAQILARTPVKVLIFIFTYNRPASFRKLWAELNNLIRPPSIDQGLLSVEIHVQKDYSPDYGDYVPANLNSSIGTVHIARATNRRGLLSQVMDAWIPDSSDSFAIFLEDDISVSPAVLLYADRIIRRWFYDASFFDSRIAGFSLYNQGINEVTNTLTGFSYNGSPVLWSMPQSWGAIWAPRFWSNFQSWLKDIRTRLPHSKFFIEGSYSNRWPAESSYKKAILRYMRTANYGLIYPNLRDRLTLTDRRTDAALRGDGPSMHARHQSAPKHYVDDSPKVLVPEARLTDLLDPAALAQTLPMRSPWGDFTRPWNGTEEELEDHVSRCTLVVLSNREKYLSETLRHYASYPMSLIAKIVVVWNNPQSSGMPAWLIPFKRRLDKVGLPLEWLAMSTNDLQNRFSVYEHVATECVMSVDDDIVIPHEATRFLFDVWRGDFFEQIVGHTHYSRFHFRGDSGGLRYGATHTTEWSLSLTGGGCIFHRELLRHYMLPELAPARLMVEHLHNCEDLLINFVATGLSGRGPVVVDVMTWPQRKQAQLNQSSAFHLSLQSDHYAERDRCIEAFAEIFAPTARNQGAPLVNTSSVFRRNESRWGPSRIPGRQHYVSKPPTVSSWVRKAETLPWYLPASTASLSIPR